MERSLTVLLPVHNAQSTLAEMTLEVLEVGCELTSRFELVIIDEGSDDATSEVAHELTRHYPQVHAFRHGKRVGREAAIRTGLEHSRGEIVFLRDQDCPAAVDELRKLWHQQDDCPTLEKIHDRSKPRRPNYLGRLRYIAIGE